jgi:hypothetical protein
MNEFYRVPDIIRGNVADIRGSAGTPIHFDDSVYGNICISIIRKNITKIQRDAISPDIKAGDHRKGTLG